MDAGPFDNAARRLTAPCNAGSSSRRDWRLHPLPMSGWHSRALRLAACCCGQVRPARNPQDGICHARIMRKKVPAIFTRESR